MDVICDFSREYSSQVQAEELRGPFARITQTMNGALRDFKIAKLQQSSDCSSLTKLRSCLQHTVECQIKWEYLHNIWEQHK